MDCEIAKPEDNTDLRCQFGVLTRPNGSVIFCEGESTVVAGVYGPVECKMAKVLTDRAYIEMNYRPKSGMPSVRDRFYETTIRNTCDTALGAALYKRAAIVIAIQELHNSGQLISCAINAACLACLEAGIDMKFMFASKTCFLTNKGNFLFEMPINADVMATFVFVFDSVKGDIIVSHTEGTFTTEQFKEALRMCKEGSKRIFRFIKKEISKRMVGEIGI